MIQMVIEVVQWVLICIEIVVVDDVSMDGMCDFFCDKVDEWGVWFFEYLENCGKGVVLCIGFVEVIGSVVIVQDVDFEYDLFDYLCLVQLIFDGCVDVVYGSCFIGEMYCVFYFWYLVGNCFLMLFFNVFINFNFIDMEICYKFFCCEVI